MWVFVEYMNIKLSPSLLFGLFLGLITFSPLSSFAQGVPPRNSLVYVGKLNAGNERETQSYVDRSSIRQRGRQTYYVLWIIWKYEQSGQAGRWLYTKEDHVADCQNWGDGRFNFSSVDRNGRVIAAYRDSLKIEPAEPGSIEDKSLEVVCQHR